MMVDLLRLALRGLVLVAGAAVVVVGIGADPWAAGLGLAGAALASLAYWDHAWAALGEAAEKRWRDRYQGHMRASAEAMARESREGALLLAGRTENLALTFQGHAERLQQELGGARAVAEERAAELAAARARLARPKPPRRLPPAP